MSVNTYNITRSVQQPFYGFTIDFWNNQQSGGKWYPDAGILTLNLSNPNLIALTKELTPAILRIGGSPEDSVVYDIDGECSEKYGLPKYDCSQVTNSAYYGCINKTHWNQINEFALETGVTLIFGLNACYGRVSPSHSMNFSNIINLVNYTNSLPNNHVFGFEFGNELDQSKVSLSTYANDFYNLFKIMDGKYKILGNDNASPGQATDFMTDLSNIIKSDGLQVNDVLYRLTYHHYPNCPYPNGTLVFSPDFYCVNGQSIINYSNVFYSAASKFNVSAWMGEGAEHTGGGLVNISDTFVDCFYYVYQLGTVLSLGINGTMRSDLIGGDYELIDRYTLEPNPDYWVLYIWKQLIGHNFDILDSGLTPKTNVRAFAFRLPSKAIVLVFVNFDMVNTASIKFDIKDNDTTYDCEEYFMLPKGSNLQTQTIMVNDVLMKFSNGQFPTLQPVKGNAESVDVPPAQIAFVVLTPSAS